MDLKDGTDKMLCSLRQFKHLKRLNLRIHEVKLFSFKEFKGFEGLTHLTIALSLRNSITWYEYPESILTDIDINLPKLRSLTLSARIIASEWTADILSRLSSLETIHIAFLLDERIRAQIETKLIEKCKRITKTCFKPLNVLDMFSMSNNKFK